MAKTERKADHGDEKLYALRHSTAHLLAAAVTELYPDAKYGIGRDAASMKAVVGEEALSSEDKLSLETPLADAGIDSLDALSILFAIEEEFHISIPDERARSMKTFGDMVDAIEALVT